MTKPAITKYSVKGSPLTTSELDTNFQNLADATVSVTAGSGGTQVTSDLNGNITLVAGSGISLTGNNTAKTITITNTSSSNIFNTIAVSGQSNVVADSSTDTLTLVAGTGISITTNASTDSITINNTASTDLLSDLTPQLGGNLDVNGQSIVSVSNGNIVISPNGSGKTKISSINYNEGPIYTISYASTITPDVSNGNVQQVTLTGNVTFNAFSNPVAGQSLTLIVKQDATAGRTLTSTMKFLSGLKTLSVVPNAIDVITVFYDGTNYLASLGKNFK